MAKTLSVRQISKIAIMACIQYVVFVSFSQILYLEMITFITVIFALSFERRESVLASIVFGLLNLLYQGVQPWSIMYIIIFSSYSFIVSSIKDKIKDNLIIVTVLCTLLSFLNGQLIQLPFALVSKNLTILYWIMGFKTSLIQAGLTCIVTVLCYKPLFNALIKIKRRIN